MEEVEKLHIIAPNEDRISNLLDHLIEDILGFLPVKEAIKTCVLSKRWRYSWISIQTLNFSKSSETGLSLVTFIGKTLQHFSNSKLIKKLHLALDVFFLNSWVEFAVNHEVEELSIEFEDGELIIYVELPCNFFHVKKLSLKHCILHQFPKAISWVSLRVLSLFDVQNLSNRTMEAILSGSPVLECLNLYRLGCMNAKCIRMASTSLKELVLNGFFVCNFHEFHKDPVTVEISCPNLLSLNITGRVIHKPTGKPGIFSSLKWKLLDISSLVEATIDLWTHGTDAPCLHDFKRVFVDDLLQKLNRVTKLTIGDYCLKFLSILESCDDLRTPLPMSSHICLELNTIISCRRYFPGIVRLLENTPDLQKLTLHRKSNIPEVHHLIVPLPLPLPLPLPKNGENKSLEKKAGRSVKCFDGNLKSIEIVGFVTCEQTSILFGKILEFIRKNARIQIIIISTRGELGDVTTQTMSSVPEAENLMRSYKEFILRPVSISLSIYLSYFENQRLATDNHPEQTLMFRSEHKDGGSNNDDEEEDASGTRLVPASESHL